MRTVVFGFLGTQLDSAPPGPKRWERWRPTVDLCRQDDLVVDRLELLSDARHADLARQVEADLRSVSPETEVRHRAVDLDDPWDFEEVYAALHDLARTLSLDPDEERLLVHITTGTHVAQICLFLLTESRHLPGRLLQTSPPKRADGRPGRYSIIDLDLSRYDRLAARFEDEHRESTAFLKAGIETRSAAFNRTMDRLERIATRSRAPILLTGPTGAGKSALARRIYELRRSRRLVDGPLVEVNCATLRGEQAMPALFGHTKGAFTGATTARAGLLKSADRGVLFLDEIAELGADEQAMLLRAIEERRFLPVGADREVESEFQLLAGTNRDLGAAVRDGRFREDLLARLDLWTFDLPALRDRREDLAPNLEYELRRVAEESGRRITMNREARDAFLRFAADPTATWDRNFRDLNAAVTRMATLATSGRIGSGEVDEEILRLRASWRSGVRPAGDDDGEARLRDALGDDRVEALDRFDRVQLADVLHVCAESATLSEAGRTLFAASRARRRSRNDADRLRKYLARFGLSFEAVSSRPAGRPAD